jgi:hypothetical protein
MDEKAVILQLSEPILATYDPLPGFMNRISLLMILFPDL